MSLTNERPELIEEYFLQKELYEKYENEKNARSKLKAALRLQDYNYDNGLVDESLCSYIREALKNKEPFTYRNLTSPQKITYDAWFDLINPEVRLDIKHLLDNLESLKTQPLLKSREEIIFKTRLAIVKAFKEKGELQYARIYLQTVKSALEKSKNKNSQELLIKISELEKELN